ncbi:MAG: copper chaperone PCu(A)C [Dehalococcoidia bacterium]|nr:copper chaperone PCu(A)C [Chloroflexi bacterium CFX7]MCK6563878.1 copper chaperone PCu(A)C [Dehalococcoidia bacterium]NUQ56468.1 copper chaperone PCu(A)C [Dehalococcoidia bacterium]RIL03263.1 MAG: hypothetical protein DCC78_04340 [bacterium]
MNLNLIRRGAVALAVLTTLAFAALGLAACDDEDEGSGGNADVIAAITALDNAGLHEIEVELTETGTPPGDAQATALRMQSLVKLTAWPSDLSSPAEKLASLLGEMAAALAGNDTAKAKEATTKAHNAAHDFSFATWTYLQKKAGVAEEKNTGMDHASPTGSAGASPTAGHTMSESRITVENPRARVSNTDVSAAYFTVKNSGSAADRLLSASVDSSIAGMVQLHTMVMEGGTAKMHEVQSIEVPANGSVELKPGGFHVMIMNLKRELKEGETLTIRLKFEKAGMVEVKAPVQQIVTSGMSGGAMSTPTTGH